MLKHLLLRSTLFADAGPHPNRAHAEWGRRARRLEPDPETAPQVSWIFAERLAGHSMARIARALNDAAVPCPSAADPERNPHRSGNAWTLHTVRAILGNPRYTGLQVWNRQRTDSDLVDPANTGLGYRPVQRWNLPEGWVISAWPAHPPIVTEAAACPDAARPPNAYIREDQILSRLPALGILIGAPARSSRKQDTAHSPATAGAAHLISYLRVKGITLTYDPDEHTLRAGSHGPMSVTIDRKTPAARR